MQTLRSAGFGIALGAALQLIGATAQCDLSGCDKTQISKAYVKRVESEAACGGDTTGEDTNDADASCQTVGCDASVLLNSFGACGVNPTCATALAGDSGLCTSDGKADIDSPGDITCAQDPCSADECCEVVVGFQPVDRDTLKTAVDACIAANSAGDCCRVDDTTFTDAGGVYPCTSGVHIRDWDTSQVTNMHAIFYNTNFDQDISSWDVSSVTDFSQTFWGSKINKDLSCWDVSSIVYNAEGNVVERNFDRMFQFATSMTHKLCWDNLPDNFDPSSVFQFTVGAGIDTGIDTPGCNRDCDGGD